MDRAPGLSVRLKLTLSYAGFLMLAGVLMLAAVWVVVLRYIPDGALSHMHPSWWFVVDRSDPLHGFGSIAAIVLAFLLVFGLLGGWLLAGRMLAPLTRITDATRIAATGSLSHRIELEGRRTSSASSPTASTPCSRGSKHTSPNSRDSQPTPPTNCAPRWRSRRRCSTSPATIRTATPASSSTASTPSTPERSTSPKHCSCSAAPTSGPSPENTSTCPSSRKKPPRRSSPSQRNAASPSRPPATLTPTIGSHALLLQLTTNLVHNAIVHNLPEQGTVWVTTSVHPEECGAHRREHRREAHPAGQSATLAEPFLRGTERIRTDHAGVGLGLAIVKSITQAHDGTLTLTPRAAGGLRVTVQLPAAPLHTGPEREVDRSAIPA